MDEEGSDDRPDAEFETWHAYDAGGPVLSLKVRYREGVEVPDWQDGPDLFAALALAEAQGWHAYDREPGEAPGEYAIYHLKRGGRPPVALTCRPPLGEFAPDRYPDSTGMFRRPDPRASAGGFPAGFRRSC